MTEFAAKFRRPRSDDLADLAEVAADDALVEALRSAPLFDDPAPVGDVRTGGSRASGPRMASIPTQRTNPDVVVNELLRAWRREIESAPLPAPVDADLAVSVIRQSRVRRRALRPIIAVAAAITGVMVGSAAIGARSATPDSFLWPVTQLLWDDRADSVMAGQTAREGLDSAHQALEAGHPEAAATALVQVTSAITLVAERDGRETLESEYQSVKSQIEVTKTRNSTTTTSGGSTSTTAAPGTSTGSLPPVVPSTAVPSSSTSSSDVQSSVPSLPDSATAPVVPTGDGGSGDQTTPRVDPTTLDTTPITSPPTTSTVFTTPIEPSTQSPVPPPVGGLDVTEIQSEPDTASADLVPDADLTP